MTNKTNRYIFASFLLLILAFFLTWVTNTSAQTPDGSDEIERLVAILQTPPLGSSLSDEQLHDKSEALRLLSEKGTPTTVLAIIPFLADSRLNTVAMTALLNSEKTTVLPFLREALSSQKGHLQAAVVQTLGTLQDTDSIPKLAELLSSDDSAVIEAVLASFGKMRTTEADDFLIKQLEAESAYVRTKSASALIHSAAELLQSGNLQEASRLITEIRDKDIPAYQKGEASYLMLKMATGDVDSADFFADMITSDDTDTFELSLLLLPTILTWPAEVQDELLKEIHSLSIEKLTRIFLTLSVADLTKIEPSSIRKVCDKGSEAFKSESATLSLQTTILGFLGKGAPLAVQGLSSEEGSRYFTLLSVSLTSPEPIIADAAARALTVANDIYSEKILRSQATNSRSSVRRLVFDAMGKCSFRSSLDLLQKGMDDPEPTVRCTAYRAFASAAAPLAEDFRFLLNRFTANLPENEATALFDALLLVGKRTSEPARCAAILWERFQTVSPEMKCRYIDILVQIGNEDALKTIVQCALDSDDVVMDQATKVLGEWINLEAAPALLELAQKHPVEKYRIRTIRGYIRLVRQMGSDAEQKVDMADQIAPFVQREDEKKLLTELYATIENTRKDKLIFDGKTFNGWEGDTAKTFRIEENALIAGSLKESVPRNEFLCSTSRYENFTLTLECKVIGEGGNAGIQFRSDRIPDHYEMIGYQADMTTDGQYWGKLYDESRRKKMLVEVDPELINKAYKPNDWNRYKIICWGNNIQIYLNEVMTVNYFEIEPVAKDGVIGLQIHGGPPSEAWYRNVRIENYTPH